MRTPVVNASARHYNLGARKLADWLTENSDVVTYSDGYPGLFGGQPDKVYISVIFSWHAPVAAEIAMRYKANADIECGGPGMFALAAWWKQQSRLACHRGLDDRFERQRGREAYRITYCEIQSLLSEGACYLQSVNQLWQLALSGLVP